jgi:hypothetical protein
MENYVEGGLSSPAKNHHNKHFYIAYSGTQVAGLVTSHNGKGEIQEEKEKGRCCMKRLMAILVLVVAVPAMAAVNFTATDAGNGKLQIAYTTTDGDLPRGVALRISLTNGAVVDTTAALVVNPAFNAFIDYAYSNPLNYAVGAGHPLAKATEAGALAANASDFSVSMGVLDQTGNQGAGPATAANLITIQLKGPSANTTATITGDTLRGPASGVVGSVLTSNLPISAVVNFAVIKCVKADAPFFAAWQAFGEPACWCYARNCKGDADGKSQGLAATGIWYVGTNDLNILVAAWQVKESPKGPGVLSITNGICADFNRDQQGLVATGVWRVGTNDLNKLVANWQVKEPTKGPGIGDCMATGHYNFFVAP